MKTKFHPTLLIAIAIAAKMTLAASGAGDVVGKVVAGYQGWFYSAGDGSPLNSWGHTNLEMWPDVGDFDSTFLGCPFYQAGKGEPAFTGNLGNGKPARMFSSYTQQVANTHFLWMKQSGIDCAAVQRFASTFTNTGNLKKFHDNNALHIMKAAEAAGRKFYIMYDCSATSPMDSDWTNTIVGTLHLTSSPAYARQNGKPVVCIFGVGKSDRGSIADWVAKINWFKAQGCYFIGGPLQGWRGGGDMSAYNACDMIMPWMVGRSSGFETFYAGDLAYCDAHNLDYQADIYPGTAFYNTNGEKSPKNQIPRMHGDFMWSQFAAARKTGVKNVYISMFDEAQEATSIFKIAENASQIPAGKYFLTLDADGIACSSDFYLRLTNDGGKMVKGQIDYTTVHPTQHMLGTAIRYAPGASGGPEGSLSASIDGRAGLSIFNAEGKRLRTPAGKPKAVPTVMVWDGKRGKQ